MLGPVGSDIFLPGLPTIAEDLGSPVEQLQLTLSAFTIGLAAGQLVAGPLSDAIGRRIPLLAGTAASVVAGVGAALAPHLTVLVIACLVMGLGTSFGAISTRAIVSDLATGDRLTRSFALLNTLVAVGPVIAPLIGIGLMLLWGWRGIFAGFAILCAVALAAAVRLVPESLQRHLRAERGFAAIPPAVAAAFRSRAFLCGAFVIWFGFAASWAYIAGSPYIVQTLLGFDATVYAVTFAVNGCGLVATGLIASRLAGRLSERGIVGIGLVILTIGVVLAGVPAVLAFGGTPPSPWFVLPSLFCFAAAIGFYMGPGMALAVRDLRKTAGTTLAVIGAVQFVIAAIVSPLVAIGDGRILAPFAIIVIVGTAVAWLAWAVFRPARLPSPAGT